MIGMTILLCSIVALAALLTVAHIAANACLPAKERVTTPHRCAVCRPDQEAD